MLVLSYLIGPPVGYLLKVACCIRKQHICKVTVYFICECFIFAFLHICCSVSFIRLYTSLLCSFVIANMTFNLSLLICQLSSIWASWSVAFHERAQLSHLVNFAHMHKLLTSAHGDMYIIPTHTSQSGTSVNILSTPLLFQVIPFWVMRMVKISYSVS